MAKRRLHRHLQAQVADDDLLLLLSDGDPDDCESQFSEFLIADVARELWRDHRDAILQAWIRHSPGCRPWPFWRFDAPEPRRKLSGKGEPVWSGLAWGIPAGPWEGGRPRFETQAAFLERHGLMLDGEGPAVAEPHPEPASAPHWTVYR